MCCAFATALGDHGGAVNCQCNASREKSRATRLAQATSGIRCSVLCLLLLAFISCQGAPPFTPSNARIESIDILAFSEDRRSTTTVERNVREGPVFDAFSTLLEQHPDRWESLDGARLSIAVSHVLICRLDSGGTVRVSVGSGMALSRGWVLALSEQQDSWLAHNCEWYE